MNDFLTLKGGEVDVGGAPEGYLRPALRSCRESEGRVRRRRGEPRGDEGTDRAARQSTSLSTMSTRHSRENEPPPPGGLKELFA